MHRMSPGVERALEAARARARAAAVPFGLRHLALALLEDDEGRPAVLLQRAGLSPAAVRAALDRLDQDFPLTDEKALLSAARDWSVVHRHDPEFLTDALLLAVLRFDPHFAAAAARCGLDLAALEAVGHQPGPGHDPDSGPSAELAVFAPPAPGNDLTTARILDANLNRAREAARVLEDYCRFVLDDRLLTEEVKQLRHGLGAVAAALPVERLMMARDTTGDVGTTVETADEYQRESLPAVAVANLKRLQEALRTLEEYGKLVGPDLGRQCEALRYRAYSLERAVVIGWRARDRLAAARLYLLVSGTACRGSLEMTLRRAIAGGVDLVQLREKELTDRELLARARDVRRWTRETGVLFIVNDRPDIARLVGADGVHLGQDDLPVREARRLLGPDALVGVSTHDLDQVRRAVLDGADYLGVGPVFPSQTKSFDRFPGLEFVAAAARQTSLPAFALGGIGPENVARVVAAGASRVAVGAALAGADDPESVARALKAALPNR